MRFSIHNAVVCAAGLLAGLASVTVLSAQEAGQVRARVFVNGNQVKGAPYTAEAVTETTQVLADGNKIAQTRKEKLFRDGQGRERREISGPGESAVTISDPVAGTMWMLNTQNQTAQKGPFFQLNLNGRSTAVVQGVQQGTVANAQTIVIEQDGQNFRYRTQSGEPAPEVAVGGGRGGPGGRGGGRGPAPEILVSGRMITPGSSPPVSAKEDLGTRNIEGVIATGTKTTNTIPAGQIGNQQPLQIVDEVWYSDELKANVMTRHSDPRSGETVYRLTNIYRGEPDPSLFQTPPNYTILEGPQLPAIRNKE